MTNPVMLLARATAKGSSYEIATSGGTVQFTAAEVGHALAGRMREEEHDPLPEGAYRVLLVRFASGSATDVATLIRLLRDEDASKRRDWVDYCAQSLSCACAVQEYMEASICPACNGRGQVMDDDLLVPCEVCDKTGRKPRSAGARARALGLPLETFRRRPAETYYLSRLARLYHWESIGLWRMLEKLS